jgi:hypothetical protein
VRFSVVLTVAGVLAILAGLGSVVGAVAKWTVSRTCFPAHTGGHLACVTTGPGSDLSLSPWAYLAIGLGLFALGGLLFSLAGVRRGPFAAARAQLSFSANPERRR